MQKNRALFYHHTETHRGDHIQGHTGINVDSKRVREPLETPGRRHGRHGCYAENRAQLLVTIKEKQQEVYSETS